MCTLSWCATPGGHHLFFTRDEQRSRAPGLPPSLGTTSGTRYLAPLDPDGGGTWLWVNEFGLIAALLNHYERHHLAPANPRSRGRLLLDLVASPDLPALLDTLRAHDPRAYRPYWLVALAKDGRATLVEWDGQRLATDQPFAHPRFHTTSSHRPADVRAFRTHLFQRTPSSPAALRALHDTTAETDPAFGVRMDRADARSQSLTEIEVTPRAAVIRYYPRLAADGAGFGLASSLDLPLRI